MQSSRPQLPIRAEPASAPNGARSPAAFEAFLRAIERVEQVVDQETYALRRHQNGNLDEFNRRKSHGLLELTRAARTIGDARPALGPRLRALQAKLSENSAVLRMHLEAVQEISAVMARAIRDGESDGTYSAGIRFAGDQP